MGEIRLNTVLEDLILNIEETVKRAKENLAGVVNSTMTETYWLIGKYIVESEQNGNIKAAYGSKLLTTWILGVNMTRLVPSLREPHIFLPAY